MPKSSKHVRRSQNSLTHSPAATYTPQLTASREEIVALANELNREREKHPRRRTIFLDLSDLIEYVRHNDTVSGIQRVVANLILHAPAAACAQKVELVFVFPEYHRKRIYSVDPTLINNLLWALDQAGQSRIEIDQAVDEIYRYRKLVMPVAGDVFTIAGAFWTYDNYDLLNEMRARGVGIVNFIHDLIQISHPEFVFEAATKQFRRALIDILSSSTGLLTNSEYVAKDIRRFMSDRTDVQIPVRSVSLATELAPLRERNSASSPEIAAILKSSYVLSVSTIEVRKNHSFIVRLWQRLMAEKTENLPDLVFVGKIGWDIDPFIQNLEATEYLGGKVKILSRVSDGELAELYRGAQFTMYMSFVEGFGLPVAESLAYGVPCISSNQSSMPEVGGSFARYLDPYDVAGGAALVRRLLEQPDELAKWRKDIATKFKIRTWKEFAKDYIAGVLAFAEPDGELYNNRFSAGEIYGMGRWEVVRRDGTGETITYLGNTRVYGWNAVEDWGCWSASRRAEIRLRTDLEAGTEVAAYVMVQAPGQHQSVELNIEAIDRTIRIGSISSIASWKSFHCRIGPSGMLALTFHVEGEKASTPDVRDLYIGLLGVAFCPSDSPNARLKIVEAIALDPARMGQPPNLRRPSFNTIGTLADDFDSDWYLAEYPDVRLGDLSPREHYEVIGKRLGRKPRAVRRDP